LPKVRGEIFEFLEKYKFEPAVGTNMIMTSPQDSVMSTSAESNKAVGNKK
jgi:hypothetical protein